MSYAKNISELQNLMHAGFFFPFQIHHLTCWSCLARTRLLGLKALCSVLEYEALCIEHVPVWQVKMIYHPTLTL